MELKQKIVYKDGDYTKVIYGAVEYENNFVIIKQSNGREVRIGSSFVVSITPVEQ